MTEPHESAAEREEKAAIRRRWITIGEVLAVLGVVISALALWNSWVERRADERDRAAEKAEQGAASRTLILKASGGGKRLALAPRDAEQVIQGQTLLFATPLGLGAIDTTDARIEADWVKRAVKKAHEMTPGSGPATPACRWRSPPASPAAAARWRTPPSTISATRRAAAASSAAPTSSSRAW